jgi:hypothetical protein
VLLILVLSGSTVNIAGTTNTIDTTNLYVKDAIITLNKGGVTNSAGGSGIEIEENSIITGYIKVSATRDNYNVKIPSDNTIYTMMLKDSSGNSGIAGSFDISSNLIVNTNKFRVTGASGNVSVAGTMDISGNTNMTSNLIVNTNKFRVTGTTGNVSVAGTMDISGNTIIDASFNAGQIKITKPLPIPTTDPVTKYLVLDANNNITYNNGANYANQLYRELYSFNYLTPYQLALTAGGTSVNTFTLPSSFNLTTLNISYFLQTTNALDVSFNMYDVTNKLTTAAINTLTPLLATTLTIPTRTITVNTVTLYSTNITITSSATNRVVKIVMTTNSNNTFRMYDLSLGIAQA